MAITKNEGPSTASIAGQVVLRVVARLLVALAVVYVVLAVSALYEGRLHRIERHLGITAPCYLGDTAHLHVVCPD